MSLTAGNLKNAMDAVAQLRRFVPEAPVYLNVNGTVYRASSISTSPADGPIQTVTIYAEPPMLAEAETVKEAA
jgi:hypothetical protein